MPSNAATILSAIAATFAALSSLLIMRIQRRNLLESTRPELVLTGWSRAAEGAGEIITFDVIKNVGRGVALHVSVDSFHQVANRPTAVLSTTRFPILAPEETVDVGGRIHLWWKNVPPDGQGNRFLPITITIGCSDSQGFRHQTQYQLLVVELRPNVGVMDAIAPGVMLSTRTTTTRPARPLKVKLLSWVRRVRSQAAPLGCGPAILKVRGVELVGPHSVRLKFSDGTSRRVNLLSELTGPVFEPLRDPAVFSRVLLDPIAGAVVWPNGADFAPEFLHGLPEEPPATDSRVPRG